MMQCAGALCLVVFVGVGPTVGRLVDGKVVPPFGASLESSQNGAFSWSDGFQPGHLEEWPNPDADTAGKPPLAYGKWTGGPYHNTAGEHWVAQINAWYRDGTAAGLTQDTFRSCDNGHSSLRRDAYPQLRFLDPKPDFGPPWEILFKPRVTMGVQSYGMNGNSVFEGRSRLMLRNYFQRGGNQPTFERLYKLFYENNFLFVAPAVGTFKAGQDRFAFLSPYYLHSIGASGTDSTLMKPLVYAAAALPPALKTRILTQGLYVPTLMYLFKSHIAGSIESPEAHVPAYTLPPEAAADHEGPAPFLDALLTAAHSLQHIPPVCRLRISGLSVETDGDHAYGAETYHEESTYAFTGALRPGQSFVMTVDLRFSWTDQNHPIEVYKAELLRGEAEIEPLNKEKSVLKIRVPWRLTAKDSDFRTDVLFLVHDGTYFSAPAYLSVRNLGRQDPITLGIRARGPLTDRSP